MELLRVFESAEERSGSLNLRLFFVVACVSCVVSSLRRSFHQLRRALHGTRVRCAGPPLTNLPDVHFCGALRKPTTATHRATTTNMNTFVCNLLRAY